MRRPPPRRYRRKDGVGAASFGDAVVVATTLRRLTAFDRAGRWLWSAPEDEIAVSLTRLGPAAAPVIRDAAGKTGGEASGGQRAGTLWNPVLS